MIYRNIRDLPAPPSDKSGWPWSGETLDVVDVAQPDHPLPKISIVTPTYNAAESFEGTIRSVLLQRYPNIEYIVIDAGSTDNTLEIIKRYAYTIDYWVSEPDGGIYDGYNKGICAAKGEWIYFLGAGDKLINSTVLLEVSPYLDTLDFAYGNVFCGNHGPIGEAFTKSKLIKNNICHQSIFYRRNLFTRLGLFDSRYIILADWVFNMRCFGDPLIRIAYVNKDITHYQGDGRSTYVIDSAFYKDKINLVRKNLGIWHWLLMHIESLNRRRQKGPVM